MERDKLNLPAWVKVVETGSNYYRWIASENTGRSLRTAVVGVRTITPPTASGSTTFTQFGAESFLSILSTNPRTVGYQQGKLIISCKTNVASVNIKLADVSKNAMAFTYEGASAPNISVSGSAVGEVQKLTFIGDPGSTSEFQFYVTYSYQANNRNVQLLGEIQLYSGSVAATQSVTQSTNPIQS